MAFSISPRLRMDKSRPHATIHGERAAGDRHAIAFYQQDGIHYDAHGYHIPELIDDDKVRGLIERRLRRQQKLEGEKAEVDAQTDAAPDDDPDAASTDDDAVNLEAWLRGEVKYQWHMITSAVRKRYSQNLNRTIDVLECLVYDHEVVSEDQLADSFKDILRNKGDRQS
jgi:hypothetical protein